MHSAIRDSTRRQWPGVNVRGRVATIWILQLALLYVACSNQHSAEASKSPSIPSPVPTATKCWIYDKIYPATEAAFDSQGLSFVERQEVETWSAPMSPAQLRRVKSLSPSAAPPTASERHLIRWMRSPWNHDLFVFIARPISTTTNGYFPWVALNGNVLINPITCEVGAYPTA
jgi:hypothetical protein